MSKSRKGKPKKKKPVKRESKRQTRPRNPLVIPAKLRGGAGLHKDKKQEEERKICRRKVEIPDD